MGSRRVKGQGLALNTIAIAAIVLVALVIILAVIYGISNKVLPFFGKQTKCEAQEGGACSKVSECLDVKIYGLGCEEGEGPDTPEADRKTCCVKRTA